MADFLILAPARNFVNASLAFCSALSKLPVAIASVNSTGMPVTFVHWLCSGRCVASKLELSKSSLAIAFPRGVFAAKFL